MAIDIRPTSAPTIAFGICLVLAGVGLMLESTHVVQPGTVLQCWPVGLVVFGASLVWEAFGTRRGDSTTGTVQRQNSSLPILAVIAVFFLLSRTFEHQTQAASDDSSGGVKMYALMGGSHVVSHAAKFAGGEMRSLMGGSELDLRQSKIPSGEEAVVEVTVIMGGAVIRVPDGWAVDVHGMSVLGGIDDQRRSGVAPTDDSRAPRLVLRGEIVMGGLVIKH